MRKLAVVAFGGNALLRSGQKGTYEEQLNNVENTCESLFHLNILNLYSRIEKSQIFLAIRVILPSIGFSAVSV